MIADLKPILEHENPFVQARAIWLLPFAGKKGISQVEEMLTSEDDGDRLLAYRALRNADYKFDAKTMARLVEDESAAVRREVAVSLRHLEAGKKTDWVVSLLAHLPEGDRTYLEACGLAAETAEAEIWDALHSKIGSKRRPSGAINSRGLPGACNPKLPFQHSWIARRTIRFPTTNAISQSTRLHSPAVNRPRMQWLSSQQTKTSPQSAGS